MARLFRDYGKKRKPISVSFRDLLRYPAGGPRYTHNLHPYPARLLANIPAFFLSSEELGRTGQLVLDPFCGSGTVPLEAIVRGCDSVGADANPLARLLAKVKATPLDPRRLRRALTDLKRRIPDSVESDAPNVLNLHYWFHPHVWRAMLRLLVAIRRTRDDDVRDFLLVAFSACIRDVSLADPRLSVPVRLRHNQYPPDHVLHETTRLRIGRLRTINVERLYFQRAERNVVMMEALYQCDMAGRYLGTADDARALRVLPQGQSIATRSVDFVLTSPPYVGAQKYIRASSLSITWLGMCPPDELRSIEDNNIGREHHSKANYREYVGTDLPAADRLLKQIHRSNPLRAHIASTYIREMRQSVIETGRVLRTGGHFLLVIGEGHICGRRFDTPAYLSSLAESSGFSLRLALIDPIRSRALMTKRHHTAGVIPTESVLLFRKQ